GVLYLENQLATVAFTPELSQVLNLLSTQAAIAIENARLYLQVRASEQLLSDYNQTLEQQVAERTLLLSEEIEERQRIEHVLRQSEEQRRLTMDFTHIGSCNWNIVEDTTEWNDNHARLLGLVPSEVESSYEAWRDRVHPDDIVRVEQAIEVALATHTDFEAEYRVIYPDGSVHWLVGRGRGIYNKAGQPVRMLGVILDISEQRNAALRERKRAEEALILEERNRMAREIHDTLAQAFTGILMQATGANQVLIDDLEATQAHLEMIEELARTGLAEARRSVTALRPQLLEEGDLSSALHRLVAQMRSTIDTALIYEIQGTAYSLPTEVENNLLRIGQEALTNAMKYAEASEIRVGLTYENTRCVLQVKDNGRGFGVGNTPLSSGFGLLGMNERAANIGAQLTIQSQPEQGTEIVVIVNRASES
ncbi:MAG TPA: PAS domain-containing protein, partial [Coleofasciculaceae cyanobacterium]